MAERWQQLRREYAEADFRGEPVPGYDTWLEARIEALERELADAYRNGEAAAMDLLARRRQEWAVESEARVRAEREACALVAESAAFLVGAWSSPLERKYIAAAIRARGADPVAPREGKGAAAPPSSPASAANGGTCSAAPGAAGGSSNAPVRGADGPEPPPRSDVGLRALQERVVWTLPYSPEFVASREVNGLRQVAHDALHVMKALGRIAAECERADHGRERQLTGSALGREVADFVTCALHIASIEGFDLADVVLETLERRNALRPEPPPPSSPAARTEACICGHPVHAGRCGVPIAIGSFGGPFAPCECAPPSPAPGASEPADDDVEPDVTCTADLCDGSCEAPFNLPCPMWPAPAPEGQEPGPPRENEVAEALRELVDIIEAAGLMQLSRGVELGQTVWYVKASDTLEFCNRVLAKIVAPPAGAGNGGE